jgi:hypothetical protein
MSVLQKIRAWLRQRTEGSEDPSKIDAQRQDAMAATGMSGVADFPPNYVPPADEGRPRH